MVSEGKKPNIERRGDDPISCAIARSGLIRDGECLACEVCCRFPLADSPLAPFFCHREQAAALAAGLKPGDFLPGGFGAGQPPLLAQFDPIYRCPAFRPESNDCAIYNYRPLDCRLYPFLLMFSEAGDAVTLGLDTYCPRALERMEAPETRRLVEEMAALLDGPLLPQVVERRGLVGAWKEHVRPMRAMPALSRALCRSDLGLARLMPGSRERLQPFFEAQHSALSYHSFQSLYVWTDVFDVYWKISGDRLIVIAAGEGDAFLLCPPIGADGINRMDRITGISGDEVTTTTTTTAATAQQRGDKITRLTRSLSDAAEEGLGLLRALNPAGVSPRIQEVDDRAAAELTTGPNPRWRVRESAVEYLYERAALAELRGNALESKRQMCNRFERDHRWRFRLYDAEDFSSVTALYARWLEQRGQQEHDEFFMAQAECSFRTLHRALRDADAIGLRARVLEADGRIVGFTSGYPLADGRTFHVLHEFTDLSVKGAAQFMFREFCRQADPCDRINAGSGSGLDGLDRVKESYRPVERIACPTLVPV